MRRGGQAPARVYRCLGLANSRRLKTVGLAVSSTCPNENDEVGKVANDKSAIFSAPQGVIVVASGVAGAAGRPRVVAWAARRPRGEAAHLPHLRMKPAEERRRWSLAGLAARSDMVVVEAISPEESGNLPVNTKVLPARKWLILRRIRRSPVNRETLSVRSGRRERGPHDCRAPLAPRREENFSFKVQKDPGFTGLPAEKY